METTNVSEKKNREARNRESARERERECDNEGEISLPRPRTLAISSLAFFFQTRLEFPYENLAYLFFKQKGEARDREGPQRNTIVFR